MTERVSVVAAAQSPTLLNSLAQARQWSFRVADLGDCRGLAEMSALTVPPWQHGVDREPQIVFVCTPMQFEVALARWPKAQILWFIHNGRERGLLPVDYEDRIAGAVCFSEHLRWICQAGRKRPFYFLSMPYEPAPEWSWAPNSLWTMRNRADTRSDDGLNVIAAITDGFAHTYYGQGHPTAFADDATKRRLRGSCSAYVSALHRTAGFGLAEHEAFAAGVPVIGGWWGDLPSELSSRYWGLQHDIRSMRAAIERVAQSPAWASELSALGLEYIAKHRTVARFEETVAALLSAVL